MNVSREKAEAAARICMDRFFATSPYCDFVQGVGITIVDLQDPSAPVNEKDDFCIFISLREALPPDLLTPTLEDGVKIYIEVRPEAELAKS